MRHRRCYGPRTISTIVFWRVTRFLADLGKKKVNGMTQNTLTQEQQRQTPLVEFEQRMERTQAMFTERMNQFQTKLAVN